MKTPIETSSGAQDASVFASKDLLGEMRLKQWVFEESQRLQVGMSAVYMRISRGKYPDMKCHRVTKRTIMVENPNDCFSPRRERVHVQDVKQEAGEIWLRISAANAKRGTPPMMCVMPGDILILEQIHSPNIKAER